MIIKINRKIVGLAFAVFFLILALAYGPFEICYIYQKTKGIIKDKYEVGDAEITYLPYDAPVNIPNFRDNDGNEYSAFLIGRAIGSPEKNSFATFSYKEENGYNFIRLHEKPFDESLYSRWFKRYKKVAQKYKKKFDKSDCFPEGMNSHETLFGFAKKLKSYDGEFICCSTINNDEVCAVKIDEFVEISFPEKSLNILTKSLCLLRHFDVKFKDKAKPADQQ